MYSRPQFGTLGRANRLSCLTFVSQAAAAAGVAGRYGLDRIVLPVRNCRLIGKKNMKNNDAAPKIEVKPDTYEVFVDGEKVGSEPATTLPMTQRYFLF